MCGKHAKCKIRAYCKCCLIHFNRVAACSLCVYALFSECSLVLSTAFSSQFLEGAPLQLKATHGLIEIPTDAPCHRAPVLMRRTRGDIKRNYLGWRSGAGGGSVTLLKPDPRASESHQCELGRWSVLWCTWKTVSCTYINPIHKEAQARRIFQLLFNCKPLTCMGVEGFKNKSKVKPKLVSMVELQTTSLDHRAFKKWITKTC